MREGVSGYDYISLATSGPVFVAYLYVVGYGSSRYGQCIVMDGTLYIPSDVQRSWFQLEELDRMQSLFSSFTCLITLPELSP